MIIAALLIISFFYPPQFGNRIDLGVIVNNEITEASGIIASVNNNGIFWTHNDSGDSARIYAFDSLGNHIGIFYLSDIIARDWEDISIGPGPDSNLTYIYIADIGDNNSVYDYKFILRFPEPIINQVPAIDTIYNIDIITYQYPDYKKDAECLFVDPITKDIFIIGKESDSARLYRASYPQSTFDTIVLEKVNTFYLPSGIYGVVAGDISSLGNEILLKTYTNIYYWERKPNIEESFDTAGFEVPYIIEIQGEAVCWKNDSMGYYTISEEKYNIPTHLYFYPRIINSIDEGNLNNIFFNYSYNFTKNNLNIKFVLTKDSKIYIDFYNILGQKFKSLCNNYKEGENNINFKINLSGNKIIFLNISIENILIKKKIILL